MAFGKISKQDLIDAGLDPDKLKEFQEKGVTKDDLNSLKTELATSVTDLIKAQFTELEGKLRPQQQNREENNNNNNENNNNNNNDNQPSDFERFTTDPTGYVKNEVNRVGGAAAVEFKRMARNMAYTNASKNLRGFNNSTIKAEIEEEWNKYTAEKMAQFGTDPEKLIQQIHDMILGKHHDEIMQDTAKKDGKYNLVHSGSSSGGGVVSDTNANTDKKTTLTPTEQKMARKFGMTDEEWLKQDDDMKKEEELRHSKVGV